MVGTTAVRLVRAEGRVRAVPAVGPHRGGCLAEGVLEGCRGTCPDRGANFDVRTGAVLADAFGIEPPMGDLGLLTLDPVRISAGRVEVDRS